MHKRPFGLEGKLVSEVGLGTWQIGGAWGNVEDKTAIDILRTATREGITFFDTADVYGDGRSEKFIGEFLKQHPEKIFVATKLGQSAAFNTPEKFTPEAIIQHIDNSLTRLQIQQLDLLQLHCIPLSVLQEGAVFDVLRDMKKQGKIASFGASVESIEEGLVCLEQEGVASLQVIFNIYRQKLITDLFGKAKEKGVAIIARVPLASGLLSGKMKKSTTFETTDHRNFNRDGAAFNVGETFAGLPFEIGVSLTEEIARLKPEGMTLAQMALRWILDYEAVSVVIPGASRPSQVIDNSKVSSLPPLSRELHKKLEEFYNEKVAKHIRGPY